MRRRREPAESPGRGGRLAGAGGFTLVEMIIAGGLGVLAAALGAFLFLGHLRGYQDMDIQAKLNTDSKQVVLVMSREIANTGAVLANPRQNFLMQPDRIRLSYIDLRGRYCRTDQAVIASFYVSRAVNTARGDTLFHEYQCPGRRPVKKALIVGTGRVDLRLRYFDRHGVVTTLPASVKQVEFVLEMRSAQGKSLFDRRRLPNGRIELVN